MFRRTYVGLDIHNTELRAIGVRRSGRRLLLAGHQRLMIDDALQNVGFQPPNVLEPASFIDAVQQVVGPLLGYDKRIAVALPDRAGQLFVVELDSPFKSYDEGRELIRWQLKEKLPDNAAAQVCIDFQILQRFESGSSTVLAAVMHQDVLAQYELLISQAGFAPEIIDFHALALYRAYSDHINLEGRSIFIAVDGEQFCLLLFEDGHLKFNRQRRVAMNSTAVLQEVQRTLAGLRANGMIRDWPEIFFYCDWENDREKLYQTLCQDFEVPFKELPAALAKLVGVPAPGLTTVAAMPFSAAFGMVRRSMGRA